MAGRAKVSDRLSYHPPAVPFNARTISKRERKGYLQEDLVFQTTAYTEVPATILIPAGASGPHAALVALHDHGGFYYFGREKLLELDQAPRVLTEFCQKIYEGVPYAPEFARAGYVVLVIDAFYFGQRRLREDTLPAGRADALAHLQPGTDDFITQYNKLANSYEPLVEKTILMAGASWPGMILWDDLRSVDYLATRPEVDKNRIGCLGLSLGGFRSAYLAGCHPAVRSAVVTCWMSSFGPMLANYPEHHTWMCYAPGLYRFLDLPDVAAMTAPNWLLVQYGRRDELFPMRGKQESAEKISRIYSKAGVSSRFKSSFFDAPHMFSRAMQKEAVEWFDATLKA
jgi:dienelactone hydrolase